VFEAAAYGYFTFVSLGAVTCRPMLPLLASRAACTWRKDALAPATNSLLCLCQCLTYDRGRSCEWAFKTIGGDALSVRLTPYIDANNWSLLRTMAVEGLGIAGIGGPLVESDIRHGLLVEMLQDFEIQNPEGSRLGDWVVHAEKRPLQFKRDALSRSQDHRHHRRRAASCR
jgi:DNA-binding transcriptional LysR family regulator